MALSTCWGVLLSMMGWDGGHVDMRTDDDAVRVFGCLLEKLLE